MELCLNTQGRICLSFFNVVGKRKLENCVCKYGVFNPNNFTCDHKYLLFCDVPLTFFGTSKLSSGMSLTKEYNDLEAEFVGGASQYKVHNYLWLHEQLGGLNTV
jgi:hypothetical protein